MHRTRLRQLLVSLLFLSFGAGVGCSLGTESEPAIPMVTVEGTFVTVATGALDGAIDGSATILPESGPLPRAVELVSSDDPTFRIVFERGLLGSSAFDFAPGTYSFAGIPGIRAVDAYVYGSDVAGAEYVATSGSLRIETSTAESIRGRFDLTATAFSASGASMGSTRLRGTFWAVPETP